jgi:ribosomal protein L19E
MKKIIALFTLTLALGFNANAQDAKKSNETIASTQSSDDTRSQIKLSAIDITESISSTIKIDENTKNEIRNVIISRQEALLDIKNEEERLAIFNKYTEKIKEYFTREQIVALQRNKEVYTKLTAYQSK